MIPVEELEEVLLDDDDDDGVDVAVDDDGVEAE
jgi:hypothetical protein